MKSNAQSSLLTKGKLSHIGEANKRTGNYLDVVQSFARLTYESIYIINYEDMTFEYVSENPLFLCGRSSDEVLRMGYDFYFQNVPEQDLALLHIINEAGFDFFAQLPIEEKKMYSITYDFQLKDENGKLTLINHKLTPLFLTEDGKMWKAICIVSLSHQQTSGNIYIYKEGSARFWTFNLTSNTWTTAEKPKLSDRETEVLRLYAQGLTISQIAAKMFVVPDTIKYYRRRIFETLAVRNMTEALSYAINNKIL